MPTDIGLINGEQASDLFIPISAVPASGGLLRNAGGRISGFGAAGIAASEIPTTISKTENYFYTLETEQAAKLGINYIGTFNSEITKKMKVYVREYAKYSSSESTDGKASLRFGAMWRATVLVDQTDATGNVNFAVVAASATLKNLAVQVSITHQGFDKTDQVGIDRASQLAMDATKDGLNVSSFAKFTDAVEKAIKAVISAKAASPLECIGVKLYETDQLLDSVARTFALSYIAKGYGCVDAIDAFPVKNDRIDRIIRGTYEAVSQKDGDASDPMAQLKARQLIEGVRIPLTRWWELGG